MIDHDMMQPLCNLWRSQVPPTQLIARSNFKEIFFVWIKKNHFQINKPDFSSSSFLVLRNKPDF